MFSHDRDDYIERKLLHMRSQLIAYQDIIENGNKLNEITHCNIIDGLQLSIEEVLNALQKTQIIKQNKKSEVFNLV
jgi:hypothetical protein